MKSFGLGVAAGALLMSAAAANGQQPAASSGEARQMFDKLVSFQTVAGRGAVPAMADYLATQFKAAGFAPSDIETLPLGDSVGMTVRYRGAAGSTAKPVLFLAHMDVVDAKRDEWKTDPWTVTEKDNALYGRGTVDNKFGVLTLAQAFIRLKREGFVPDRDLVLAFSGDEETGMATTRVLAQRLKGAAFAINSDAGGGYRGKSGSATYGYQAAEKTYATFELTVRNPGGHSSRPRVDNAIYDLARSLQKIEQHRFPSKWNDVSLASFRALMPVVDKKARPAIAAFLASPSERTAQAVIRQDPSFVGDLRTTCVATMLRAGMVENALPTAATATVNCRIFPGETVAEVRSALARIAANKKLEFKTLGDPQESPISVMPAEARNALDAVLAVRAPKASVSPYLEAGGTDGLQFRRAGIPTLGVGPLMSSDESNYNFHGINERLPLPEFENGLDHYYLFIKALAGGDGAR